MSLTYLIPPPEGWEQKTYYVAEVASGPNNPIHACILAIGFFESNESKIPSKNSSYIFSMSHYPEARYIDDFFYIKAIRKIDITIPNRDKLVNKLTNIFELEQHNLQRTKK